MTISYKFFSVICILFLVLITPSCADYQKDDYKDNTPTSGQLKVFYDEGLRLHVHNQAATFEGLYPRVSVELYEVSENAAVEALYNDSCESIVLSRKLNEQELAAFSSKQHNPQYSAVAKSGIAVIANAQSSLKVISIE